MDALQLLRQSHICMETYQELPIWEDGQESYVDLLDEAQVYALQSIAGSLVQIAALQDAMMLHYGIVVVDLEGLTDVTPND